MSTSPKDQEQLLHYSSQLLTAKIAARMLRYYPIDGLISSSIRDAKALIEAVKKETT